VEVDLTGRLAKMESDEKKQRIALEKKLKDMEDKMRF